MNSMDRIPRCVGIDLGTTYSAIAYLDEAGRAVTVPNRHGELITPSVVLFEKDGTVVVGQEAKAAAPLEPDRVVECVKRDMGQDQLSRPVPGMNLTPEEVSALILKRLKQDFEDQVGPIRGAVITVPAYFDDGRRKATRDAGEIAGLNVVAILNEPVAAALAFALQAVLASAGTGKRRDDLLANLLKPQTSLVFDLGGGTFDVTIVRSDGYRVDTVVTDGSVRLGGKDWDDRIIDYLVQCFVAEHGIDPRGDPVAMADLRVAAERAKHSLSTRTPVPLPVQVAGKRLSTRLERAKLEELTADLLAQTQLTTELIIEQAGLTWNVIDNVLPTGGSTKMPMVRRMLQQVTGKAPNTALPPDLAVAQGAAIYAAMLAAQRARSAEAGGPVEELPYEGEVLATLDEIEVHHVNSHSLGVVARDAKGDLINAVLIKKNSPIPRATVRTFGLETRNETFVRVTVLEGEARDPHACTVVGEFIVRGLPPGLPRGAPIQVTCRYDGDGRIHVEAKEPVSQQAGQMEIHRAHGLTPQRIQGLSQSVSQLVIE